MNLLRLLYWHNKGHWQSNISAIVNSVATLTVMLFTGQMLLGFLVSFTVIAQALDGHVATAPPVSNVDFLLGLSRLSYVQTDSVLVGFAIRDLLAFFYNVGNRILLTIAAGMFLKEIWNGRHLAHVELDARDKDFKVLYEITLSDAIIRRIALMQAVLFQGLSMMIALVLTSTLTVPLFLETSIRPAFPGMDGFFAIHLIDLGYLSIPLWLLFGLSLMFRRRAVKRVLRTF